jgi:hypothetical protein
MYLLLHDINVMLVSPHVSHVELAPTLQLYYFLVPC